MVFDVSINESDPNDQHKLYFSIKDFDTAIFDGQRIMDKKEPIKDIVTDLKGRINKIGDSVFTCSVEKKPKIELGNEASRTNIQPQSKIMKLRESIESLVRRNQKDHHNEANQYDYNSVQSHFETGISQ